MIYNHFCVLISDLHWTCLQRRVRDGNWWWLQSPWHCFVRTEHYVRVLLLCQESSIADIACRQLPRFPLRKYHTECQSSTLRPPFSLDKFSDSNWRVSFLFLFCPVCKTTKRGTDSIDPGCSTVWGKVIGLLLAWALSHPQQFSTKYTAVEVISKLWLHISVIICNTH